MKRVNNKLNKNKINTNKINKKAFFFTADAMIAVIVLILGVFMTQLLQPNPPVITQTHMYAFDAMDLLANTKVQGVGSGKTFELFKMHKLQGDNTVLEEIIHWCDEHHDWSQSMAQDFLQKTIDPRYGYRLFIMQCGLMNDRLRVIDERPSNNGVLKENARDLIATKRFVFVKETDGGIRGPYTAELEVWK